MALDVRGEARRRSDTPEKEVLRERSVELREWLVHLGCWVETQMAATQALVDLLAESREPGLAPPPTKPAPARARQTGHRAVGSGHEPAGPPDRAPAKPSGRQPISLEPAKPKQSGRRRKAS